MESTEAKPKKGEEKLDGIVTETYDKSLHLKKDAPVLLSPGEKCPSIYDKEKSS